MNDMIMVFFLPYHSLTQCYSFLQVASRTFWLLSLSCPFRPPYKQFDSQKKQCPAYGPTGVSVQYFFQQNSQRVRARRQSSDQKSKKALR